MSLVSTAREDATAIRSQEAKFLVKLGPKCPARAQQIGRLVVGYQQMISALRGSSCATSRARFSPPNQRNSGTLASVKSRSDVHRIA